MEGSQCNIQVDPRGIIIWAEEPGIDREDPQSDVKPRSDCWGYGSGPQACTPAQLAIERMIGG